MPKKLTSNCLNKILNNPVKVNKGVFTVGKGYYYRFGTISGFRDSVLEKLKVAGISVNVLDSGDTFKPFRGGSNFWSQSHFWVKFEIN